VTGDHPPGHAEGLDPEGGEDGRLQLRLRQTVTATQPEEHARKAHSDGASAPSTSRSVAVFRPGLRATVASSSARSKTRSASARSTRLVSCLGFNSATALHDIREEGPRTHVSVARTGAHSTRARRPSNTPARPAGRHDQPPGRDPPCDRAARHPRLEQLCSGHDAELAGDQLGWNSGVRYADPAGSTPPSSPGSRCAGRRKCHELEHRSTAGTGSTTTEMDTSTTSTG
jgi:hypothetical protein